LPLRVDSIAPASRSTRMCWLVAGAVRLTTRARSPAASGVSARARMILMRVRLQMLSISSRASRSWREAISFGCATSTA
jgi:hypothetical protein